MQHSHSLTYICYHCSNRII